MFWSVFITFFQQQQCHTLFLERMVALKRAVWLLRGQFSHTYLEVVYLVTALVPSLTACFANSPGKSRRTAV